MKKSILLFIPVFSILLLAPKKLVASESPVSFLRNEGQWPDNILYQGTNLPINIYFMKDGLSFAQSGEEEENEIGEEEYPFIVWNLKFLYRNANMQVTGDDERESKISYLYGNDTSKWVIHPAEYSVLHYRQMYRHIDMDFYGNENSLKYDYVIHQGGNVNSIRACFEGIEGLSVNEDGELEIATAYGIQVQKAPFAYQAINSIQQEVAVSYTIINDSTFGFSIDGAYDPGYDLVIDPLFQFVWCSYTRATGSSDNRNYCFGNAMDASGNVYLTGMVDGTYPTTPGAYSGPGTVEPEIFVSKFSKDGSTLIYSTYISGSSDEMGLGIAVDASGQAYIVGHAMANWTGTNTYPTTSSAFQPSMYNFGGYDAVLTVLNANGTGLVYSTYLGGSGDDEAYAVALGTAGLVYITGYTYSGGNTFPTKGTSVAAQQSAQGYRDVFVAKFNITLSGNSSLVYSIHLGGGGDDYGRSIAVNSAGNAFVTGRFQAISSPNFPTTSGAYKTTYSGGYDNMMSFVTKLSSATPVTYNYSTYLGPGSANGIAVNSSGEAYVVGTTSTFTFPTTSGVTQSVHGQDALGNANGDAFVTKLNASGSGLGYSTFLGGPNGEGGTGIAVNSAGEAYVTGVALPQFPTSQGALQSNHATGGYDLDFFVVQLNSSCSAYACGGSTYVGGNDNDYGTMMYDYASPKLSLRDHAGVNDTISVSGTSHSTNFPTTSGSYGPNKINGISDQPVFFKLTCVSTVLPVELISFSAEVHESRVKLLWKTASELNNDFFTIEKSGDGKTFVDVNQVDGAGSSSLPHDYFYWDEDPYPGTSYYRLRQTDFDGSLTWSNVVVVQVSVSNVFASAFYNSNEDAIEIVFPGNETAIAAVRLVNLSGKILKEEKFSSQDRKISVKDLPAGIYVFEISLEGKRMVLKIPVTK